MSELENRSKYLVETFERHQIPKDASILEIGYGDGRNLGYLQKAGYTNVTGIDKATGSAIEDVESTEYDVIYTMSCLFLIPKENEWVFEKIAQMAKKYIFTFEGEVTKSNGVVGRNYEEVFKPFGFEQIDMKTNMFNEYGVMRVLKRND